jgi:hypothetical protein
LGSPFNISRVLRLFIQEDILEYSAASEKWLLRRGLRPVAENSDGRLLIILETLTDMAPSANRLGDKTDARIALKLAALSARHGNSDYAPVAYASYSYILLQIIKDHKKGKKLLEAALPLIDVCEDAASKSAAYCILGGFAHHWANPLEDTVGCLARSTLEGEMAGALSLLADLRHLRKPYPRPMRRRSRGGSRFPGRGVSLQGAVCRHHNHKPRYHSA